MSKIKTIVLILSEFFPRNHKRAGEPTLFFESINNGSKIHTIRGNYPLWEKRIQQVQRGEAVLQLRKWSGVPYNSKQVTMKTLTADNGVGIQKLEIVDHGNFWFMQIDDPDGTPKLQNDCIDHPSFGTFPACKHDVNLHTNLAKNDGLGVIDFFNWFEKYDKSKPFAIIHFTEVRY